MSAHYEWIEPTVMDVIPSGSEVGADAVGEGHVALVVGMDSIAVIEGTKDRLVAMLKRALADLEGIEHDSPIPADYAPEDES